MVPDPDVVTGVRAPQVSSVFLAGEVAAAGIEAPPAETLIEVIYPSERGPIGIRGSHAPLTWEHTQKPTQSDGDAHHFKIPLADSGVNPSPMNEDVRLTDGFHHTRSMHRALTKAGFDIGAEVHRLVFPG